MRKYGKKRIVCQALQHYLQGNFKAECKFDIINYLECFVFRRRKGDGFYFLFFASLVPLRENMKTHTKHFVFIKPIRLQEIIRKKISGECLALPVSVVLQGRGGHNGQLLPGWLFVKLLDRLQHLLILDALP